MSRRRITILLVCALAALFLSGCQSAPATDAPPDATPDATPDGTAPGEESAVLEFRLGEGSLEEPKGEVTFPLDGVLAVPQGENCPVVFILHGAHGVDDVTENRYYQGFSYLAESLAQKGYLAVSININRAFSVEPFEGDEYGRAMGIFNAYYDLIKRANDREKVFDADLKGKADLTSLNFIGHSRGGDDSLYITKQLRDGGDDSVRSVLLVASPLMVIPEMSYTDVPTGVILSQYDGDVVGLETTTLFNRAWFLDEARETPVSMAFLYGGNHNQYNSSIAQEDSLAPPQNVEYIDGETQRGFLSAYAAQFLNIFNKNGDAADLGSGLEERLGFDFMPSVILPSSSRLVPDAAMTGITKDGMTVETVTFSQIPLDNTIIPFNHPGQLEEDVQMYKVSWTQAGQGLCITPKNGKWQGSEILTLLLANDSTSAANKSGAELSMELVLTDGSGASASYTLDTKSGALRYLPVKIINVFEGMEGLPEYWCAEHYTPLGTELIKLNEFEGVDLGDIRTVTLKSKSETGAIVLGGIQVS